MITDLQLKRLGLFDARVPRYTSYPTAPHFSAAVGSGTVAGWLAALPDGARISLYVHVPFCRKLCWFCACRTQGTATAGPVAAYVETVKTELSMLGAALDGRAKIGRLHWGGGTPTLMTPDLIADLSAAIRAVAPMTDDAEFSVEIDPNEIDPARLDALVEAGLNRASIGIQDFDPDIQTTIGRIQSYATTKTAVDLLRERGITSLNADVLYGLPHQTEQRITESVQKVMSLSPDRVALYGYAHVPWMARRQSMIPEAALPSAERRLDLFETARQLFAWDGYEEIGIDHFARPEDGLARAAREGRLRRNFQGYTDDQERTLIGVGASAISRFPQGYAQNAAATSAYQAAVRGGALATSRGHAFVGDDILRGRIIEELMCHFRVDFGSIARECGAEPSRVRAMADGITDAFPEMLRLDDTTLSITERGRPLTRMIARHFDAYDMAPSSHSSAI